MLRFVFLLGVLVMGAGACAQPVAEQDEAIHSPATCQASAWPMLEGLVGDWALTITADEGWTGFGTSTITRDSAKPCAIIEGADAVFNQESDTPLETRFNAVIVWDRLGEVLKIMSSDDRGYVHLGQNGSLIKGTLAFEILRLDQSTPTRQIVYKDITEDGFVWVWQGRSDDSGGWEDRLTIKYTRQGRTRS